MTLEINANARADGDPRSAARAGGDLLMAGAPAIAVRGTTALTRGAFAEGFIATSPSRRGR